jgi:hypothetical protein
VRTARARVASSIGDVRSPCHAANPVLTTTQAAPTNGSSLICMPSRQLICPRVHDPRIGATADAVGMRTTRMLTKKPIINPP